MSTSRFENFCIIKFILGKKKKLLKTKLYTELTRRMRKFKVNWTLRFKCSWH